MDGAVRGRRIALVFAAVVAVGGIALVGWTLTLPWRNPDFGLAWPVRVGMALAGLVLVGISARATPGRIDAIAGLLGVLTLVYPAFLSLGAAFPENSIAEFLGSTGHVLPILLMQFLPVVASSSAVGRTGFGREVLLGVTIVTALSIAMVGTLPIPSAPVFAALGSVLWFAQLVVAPAITWQTVRGSSGDGRRRAVLAALAASVPVLLIVTCSLLGFAAEGFGWGVDSSVALLMLGFSAAALSSGALALASSAPAGSWALRASSIVRVLDVITAVLAIVAVAGVALATRALQAPTAVSVIAGVLVGIALIAIWRSSRTITARIVDPASALRHEFRVGAGVAEGRQRQLARHAIRSAVDDPQLQLRFRVSTSAWVDENGTAAEPGEFVLARRADGEPLITVVPGRASAAARIAALGDCTSILGPAAYEARLEFEAHRAELAAREERRRLQQNLHDGLQGRLLGIALGLQLSGRDLDDPAARILVDEAVANLRSMIDDVRALGGGDLPDVLHTQGLGPALHVLLGPAVGSIVQLDLPPERFAAETEATAYFVIGEAVTNALKHSEAQRVAVHVLVLERDRVSVTVRDDGRGGADPRAGTGLRALAERVASAGGEFLVRDGLERGTVVEAVLPCGS